MATTTNIESLIEMIGENINDIQDKLRQMDGELIAHDELNQQNEKKIMDLAQLASEHQKALFEQQKALISLVQLNFENESDIGNLQKQIHELKELISRKNDRNNKKTYKYICIIASSSEDFELDNTCYFYVRIDCSKYPITDKFRTKIISSLEHDILDHACTKLSGNIYMEYYISDSHPSGSRIVLTARHIGDGQLIDADTKTLIENPSWYPMGYDNPTLNIIYNPEKSDGFDNIEESSDYDENDYTAIVKELPKKTNINTNSHKKKKSIPKESKKPKESKNPKELKLSKCMFCQDGWYFHGQKNPSIISYNGKRVHGHGKCI